jgi:Tfp pilus assembly protein PilF
MFVSRRFVVLLVAIAFASGMSCAGAEKRKNEAEAHFKLGVSHLMSGNSQAAFLKFQEALKLDPDNKEIYNGLGNVYIQLKEFGNAEKEFLKAVEHDRNFSEAYNNLCYVYYNTAQYESAVRNCRKALENPLYPTPEKAFYNIGRSQYRLGNFDGAIESFTNAVKRFPNFYQAYYGLALAYNAGKMYGNASIAMGDAIGFDSRFFGDRAKAEREFRRQKTQGGDIKDLEDYIDILHY